jgi:hypothetical protein
MSFQEIKKTEKYKLLLQQHFTFHAFHPKAVNGLFDRGRSSPNALLNTFPFRLRNSGMKI